MSKAGQRQRLGELMLKDFEDPDNFSMKSALLELEFNNVLTKEDMIATRFSVWARSMVRRSSVNGGYSKATEEMPRLK